MRILWMLLCIASVHLAADRCSATDFTTAPQSFENEEELEAWAKKQYGFTPGSIQRFESGDVRILLVFTNRGSAYTLWHVDVLTRHKGSKQIATHLSWDSRRHQLSGELIDGRLVFTSDKKELLAIPVSTLGNVGG